MHTKRFLRLTLTIFFLAVCVTFLGTCVAIVHAYAGHKSCSLCAAAFVGYRPLLATVGLRSIESIHFVSLERGSVSPETTGALS